MNTSLLKNKHFQKISLFFILSVSIIPVYFYSNTEISNRLISHDNLSSISSAYSNFIQNKDVSSYLNDLLTLEISNKGFNGKSLVFYYKSKTNCLNMFKEITPLYFETREREYKLEENPKPARICHTNYDFGELNYIRIYK